MEDWSYWQWADWLTRYMWVVLIVAVETTVHFMWRCPMCGHVITGGPTLVMVASVKHSLTCIGNP